MKEVMSKNTKEINEANPVIWSYSLLQENIFSCVMNYFAMT